MQRGRPAGGFSLIELVVVIALVAIVTAISVPQFQRYSTNADLKTAARTISADLFNARQASIEENLSVYRMTFNTGANSYALSRTDTGATLWTKSVASFGNSIALSSVSFSGGSVVSFQGRGTMSAGNLTLTNRLGSTATLTVNMTGRTYVQFSMQ